MGLSNGMGTPLSMIQIDGEGLLRGVYPEDSKIQAGLCRAALHSRY